MDLKSQRAEAVARAQHIIDAAKSAGRSLTDAERERFDAAISEVKSLDEKLKQKAADDARMAAVGALFGSSDDPKEPAGEGGTPHAKGGRGYLNLKSIDTAASKATKHLGGVGLKGLLASGEALLEVDRAFEKPVLQGVPVSNVFDLVPVRVVAPSFSFLRQNLRDNKAAVVAPGEVKPTSKYDFERVERNLKVVAHLSDGLNVMDLLDAQFLGDFVAQEMRYGIYAAVENYFFNGTGEDNSLHGLASTSGIQVQTYNKDLVLTLRSAITKVEANGYQPSGVMMHPLDYEALETSTYTLGSDNVSTPIDRMARRIWGLPVALSTALPQGTSYIVSEGSVELALNNAGTSLTWGCVGDDFQRNVVRARLEGRFEVAVLRPQGIVRASLTNVG